jgi:hypothetical protein
LNIISSATSLPDSDFLAVKWIGDGIKNKTSTIKEKFTPSLAARQRMF